MPAEFSIYRPNPENQQSEKLRRRQEAKEILENPTSEHTHIKVTKLQRIPGVNWDVTVSIGPMKTLGGCRIAEVENIRHGLQSEDSNVRNLLNREDLPDNTEAKAGTLEAWGLAKEMALKWSGMRSAMKYARDNQPDIYPQTLEQDTLSAWIKASEFGGGKSVIVNERPKGEEKIQGEERIMLMQEHAVHINELNEEKALRIHRIDLKTANYGPHYTAPDMGTSSSDMNILKALKTKVACMTPEYGGSGDPSPATARGVFHGMNALLEFMHKDGNETTFAIQGAGGKVGKQLLKDLRHKYPEANIVISDLADVSELAAKYNAGIVQGDEIFDQGGIIVPSGPSAQLNDKHLEQIINSGGEAIIGPANYLYPPGEEEEMSKKYNNRGIIVAPAALVNTGGILSVASEYVEQNGGKRPTPETVLETTAIVGPMLKHVLKTARHEGITPDEAFNNIALDEFASLCVKNGVLH